VDATRRKHGSRNLRDDSIRTRNECGEHVVGESGHDDARRREQKEKREKSAQVVRSSRLRALETILLEQQQLLRPQKAFEKEDLKFLR